MRNNKANASYEYSYPKLRGIKREPRSLLAVKRTPASRSKPNSPTNGESNDRFQKVSYRGRNSELTSPARSKHSNTQIYGNTGASPNKWHGENHRSRNIEEKMGMKKDSHVGKTTQSSNPFAFHTKERRNDTSMSEGSAENMHSIDRQA
jgi:hypothetical protein